MRLAKFKQTLWGSADGTVRSVAELEDGHLLNIIKHCKKYSWHYRWSLIWNLTRVAQERGLPITEGDPLPFTDMDGKQKTFCAKTNKYIEV